MTDTSVVDLNSDFMGFGWRDFDVFDHQVFSCFPSHCGLHPVSIASLGRAVWAMGLTLQVIVWNKSVSELRRWEEALLTFPTVSAGMMMSRDDI